MGSYLRWTAICSGQLSAVDSRPLLQAAPLNLTGADGPPDQGQE
ncbi:hypothetical protein [Paenibacillus plantiphilus]|nr:hypothetical protein [Paenibacillus plantiphilus]